MTQDELKKVLSYDPYTGVFTWRVSLSSRALAGERAGTLRKDGYVQIRIRGKIYYAHRLAFLYMQGRIPVEIDHIDRSPSNNRWGNLRPVTHSQNLENRDCKGFYERRGKFLAQIKVAGRVMFLGSYLTADAARSAYDLAEYLYREGFAI